MPRVAQLLSRAFGGDIAPPPRDQIPALPRYPVQGEYHARDGLFFKRENDGSVRVRFDADRLTFLSASEWASVVAATSLRGENGEVFREALALHTEAPLPAETGEAY